MAEAAGGVPTFKLVLVGDGGTGKVCGNRPPLSADDSFIKATVAKFKTDALIDHFRQAPLDW
jgi:hypothetical protein